MLWPLKAVYFEALTEKSGWVILCVVLGFLNAEARFNSDVASSTFTLDSALIDFKVSGIFTDS